MAIAQKRLREKPISEKGKKAITEKSKVKSSKNRKPSAFEDLKEAVHEMELYRAGKIELRSI